MIKNNTFLRYPYDILLEQLTKSYDLNYQTNFLYEDKNEGYYKYKIKKQEGERILTLEEDEKTTVRTTSKTITYIPTDGSIFSTETKTIISTHYNEDNKYIRGFNHRTGQYNQYGKNRIGNNTTSNDGLSTLTEVGLQDCETAVDCKNPTWLYFTTFAKKHPAQAIDSPLAISITGDIKYIGTNTQVLAKQTRSLNRSTSAVPFPVTIEVNQQRTGFLGSLLQFFSTGARTTLKEDGTYELNVSFSPDTNYTVLAYPEGDTLARIGAKVRAVRSKILQTFGTVEESSLHFPPIILRDDNYQEGNLTIKVTDGTSGTILNGFDAEILNTTGVKIDEGSTNGIDSGYVSTQPKGTYTVKISKEGYNDGEAECTINGNENTECVVNIVSNTQIANGQMKIVLSWGEIPTDLDSHLVKKTDGQENYHIYYSTYNTNNGSNPDNKTPEGDYLDLDDTSSFGPETTTIKEINTDSIYTYYVHNYSGGEGTVLSNSEAKIEINFNGTIRTFTVPNQEGQYWKVFEIDNGRILPCTSDCVKDDTSTLIRKLSRDNIDAYLFRKLPRK
jgi:hypothetical protein